MYKNLYGLSCVENQVLAILRSRDIPISYLYHNSAIPAQKLFECIVIHGEKPTYFTGLPRIQDTLKKMGVISLSLTRSENFQCVIDRCKSCQSNQFVLVQTTPAYTKKILCARGLRIDHFVWLKQVNGTFVLSNDIPEKLIRLDVQQNDFYGGAYFILTLQRKMTEQDKRYLLETRMFTPQRSATFSNAVDITSKSVLRIRDFVGVLKTMRYRLKAYYGNICDTEFLEEYLQKLEKQYALLEYYNLRKMQDMEKYKKILMEVIENDAFVMRTLKTILEEKTNG